MYNLQQQCGPDWASARSPRTRPSKLVATSRQVFVKEFVIVIKSILHVSKTSQLRGLYFSAYNFVANQQIYCQKVVANIVLLDAFLFY